MFSCNFIDPRKCKTIRSILNEQLIGININQKYQHRQKKQYLDYLIGPNFRGVNRFFVLSFENNAHRTS